MHTTVFKTFFRTSLIFITAILFASCEVVDEDGNIVGVSIDGNIALSWTPPTTNTDGTALTDLAGYKIYYGATPDSLRSSILIDENGITDYQANLLNIDLSSSNTYYFGIVAFNSLGVESAISNIIRKDFS